MSENVSRSKNIYDIMENDKGEIMLLLYAGESAPTKPSFTIEETEKVLELTRNKEDIVRINGLQQESIEKLKNITDLYVCEMKFNEDPEAEGEVTYAYIANLKKKEPAQLKQEQQPHEKSLQEKKLTLSQKIQQSREKLQNKNTPK